MTFENNSLMTPLKNVLILEDVLWKKNSILLFEDVFPLKNGILWLEDGL